MSSLGFSGSACGFGLGVEVSGGSEAVLCSFPRLREAPHPPFWPGRPGHDFASGQPVLCVDCTLTFATRALLNSAAWLHQRSSTFPLEARIGFAWRFGDEVRAATGRRRSATIVSTHNLAAEAVCTERFVRAFVRASRPGGFEYPAGARGYDHCDSVSGCAGLSGVRESALFRPARGLAPRWRAAGVPTPATTA